MSTRGIAKIHKNKKSNNMLLRRTVEGKRVEFSTGLPDTKQNRLYLSKNAEAVFWELYQKQYPRDKVNVPRGYQIIEVDESKGSLTFREYGEYVLSITQKGLKIRTKEAYEESFKRVCEYFGDMTIESIKVTTVEAWQNEMLDRYSPATINRKLRVVLSKILEYAEADEIIARNPVRKVSTLKMLKKPINTYDADEIKKLLALADEDFADLLRIAIFTGLRIGELTALRWCHVDFKEKTITVQEQRIMGGSHRGEIQNTTKGGYDRQVEILPQALGALKRQKERTACKGEFIFLNQYDKPYLDSKHIREKFQALLKKAGLQHGTFHDLRKTFATLMLQNGQSEAWLKQMMGHLDIAVTEKHYIGKLKADTSKFEGFLAS